MVQIMLGESARCAVQHIVDSQFSGDAAIILSPLEQGNGIAVRFVSQSVLEVLKTKKLGEILSQIEVHGFGLDNFSEDTTLTLQCLPVINRPYIREVSETGGLQSSHFFWASVHNATMYPEAKAS